MTDAWYQRALARVRTGEQPPPTQQYRAASPGVARWQDNHAPAAPAAPMPLEKREQVSVSDLLNIQQATGKAQPGQGHRLNPDPCPSCGSNQYFEVLSGKRRGPPPAPHCYNCGYNGLFEQGLEGNWANAAGS